MRTQTSRLWLLVWIITMCYALVHFQSKFLALRNLCKDDIFYHVNLENFAISDNSVFF